MAEPSSADIAISLLKSSLSDMLVKVCEAEQRSKLLVTLLSLKLLPRDVMRFTMKQLKQQRNLGSRGMGEKVFKAGKQRTLNKLADSKTDERKFRKERDSLRGKLEEVASKNVYSRIMIKLKKKINRVRNMIKVKYDKKIKGYLEEKEQEEMDELSTLREEMGEFGKLRIFNGKTIHQEERKPPVVCSKLNLSKYELEVLSKNPSFAVRAMMSKGKFMMEFEKGMIKKLYSDIGKEIVDGVTVEETPTDKEDERVMKEAEWQERKSTLVYDFEIKEMDFGKMRATEMKGNKRVVLPKASDIKVEALMEVRRKRAAQLYDLCVKKLGEGAEKGKDNLTLGEKRGLKSLKKRVSEGEIVICQTDKSGRFCILTREQYREAGIVHTSKDRKVDLEEQGEIERALNGHMRWWNVIWGQGEGWNQESRCLANLLNHGLGTCPMTLLVKDHKSWDVIPKTRSLMGGNDGGNVGISEFLSLVLEPVAREQVGNMEINATNGLLADILDLNKELENETLEVSIPEEDWSVPQEVFSSLVEDPNISEAPTVTGYEIESVDGQEGSVHAHTGTKCNTVKSQSDIRQFLKDGKPATSFVRPKVETNRQDEKFDKMQMIRNKMVESRRIEDRNMAEKFKDVDIPKVWEGERIVYAKDVCNTMVQDQHRIVVVGADVEALYPNLVDVEIANHCYKAIMKSGVKFNNINYRKALLYLAINMHKTDQRTSPLWRIMPRRTSGGGVRPGVTANPDKEQHWYFPPMNLTEMDKRMVVAMVVKVGVLLMMNTHVYSWDGESYLQGGGGPIGLRSTCAVARVVMNEWDAKWLDLCANNNIKVRKSERYMDDIRAFLNSLKMGWRWTDGGLAYTKTWEREDRMSGLSASRRTANVLVGMMNSVFPFLNFTVELGEDFADGKLPSLDIAIWVVADRLIMYEHFEKTMATNLLVEAKSALSMEVKQATLSEEVARRLRNTSLRLDPARRMEILERACVKMKTSGHSEEIIRQAVEQGIRAFDNKIKRSRLDVQDPGYQPLFPKAGWKKNIKSREKALKRGNWFRGKADKEPWEELPTSRSSSRIFKKKKPFQGAGKSKLKKAASTVVFVPSTKGSMLVKSLREEEDRMEILTGFRVKYQEAGGSPLSNAFDKNLGAGQPCGRLECPICKQVGTGEDCKSRNITYESKCKLCNPTTSPQEENEDVHPSGRPPIPREGIYIGESSRSIHERAIEHVRDAKTFSTKSHIVKHWMTSHPSLPSPPEMEFSVTGRFRDCLSRQISEALMINNSPDILLNSKGEYGHNSVSRLVVQEDAWVRRERDRLEEEQAEVNKKQVEQFKQQKLELVKHKTSKEVHLSGVAGDSSNVSCTPPEGRGDAGMDENPHVKSQMNNHENLDVTANQPVPEGRKAEDGLEDGQVGSVTAQTGTKCNIVKSVSQTVPEVWPENPSRGMETEMIEDELKDDQVDSVITQTGTECNIVQTLIYDTDEEEFARPGAEDVIPAVCSFSAVYNLHKTVKRKYTAKRKTDTHSMSHLSYFTLWWRRMEVEGRKDAKRLGMKVEEEVMETRRKQNIFMKAESELNEKDIRTIPNQILLHKSDRSSSVLNQIVRNEGVVNLSSGASLEGVGREGTQLPNSEEINTQDSENQHTLYLVGTRSTDNTQELRAATTGGGRGWTYGK